MDFFLSIWSYMKCGTFFENNIAMPRLTIAQRTWVCIEFARTANAHEVLRRWRYRWQNIRPPTIRTILKNFEKFEADGTCHNLNKERCGRNRTVRTPANIARVRNVVRRHGKRSSRRNGLNISPTSFRRIMKDIKFHPYVLVSRQKLEPVDPPRRVAFCNWFLQMVNGQNNFLDNLIVSDEAIFSLNSEVNSRNVIKYAEYGQGHPPDHYIEFKQGADQVMVWLGLTGSGLVLGPHFVRGRLDTREYLRIIRYHVVQGDFRRLGIQRGNMWWQQDGAPAHTSNRSINYLGGQFPGKVLSGRGDQDWPARSPDLTVCDFFLWGYLKHEIWRQDVRLQPTNLGQLQAAIVNQCQNLHPIMIRDAFRAIVDRARKCLNVNGLTFPNE